MADTQADTGLRIALKDMHPALDGEYPLDPETFTTRDVHDINRLAQVLPVDFEEQFEKRNVALMLALAVIALRHAGVPVGKAAEDVLWDAGVGQIKLIGEEDDAAAVPLEPTPTSSVPGSVVELPASSGTSGSGSSDGSDHPVSVPSPIGLVPSDTSVTSESETLAS